MEVRLASARLRQTSAQPFLAGKVELRFSTTVFLVCLIAGCSPDDVLQPPDDEQHGASDDPQPPDENRDIDAAASLTFAERTSQAGFLSAAIPVSVPAMENFVVAGGVAAGDMDADGDIDLFVVSEGTGDNLLYRNNGNGTFEEVSAQYGITNYAMFESGPVFADYDGDGDLDLILGGIRPMSQWDDQNSVVVLQNSGAGSFVDVTLGTGLTLPGEVDTYSISLGDVDGDNDLDLFLTHWRVGDGFVAVGRLTFPESFLWRNDGAGGFVDVTTQYGLASLRLTFTANFSDIDGDSDLDLLVASDFGNSMVMVNQGGSFEQEPSSVLSDGNGMGASVGDYDNDGDLDWFVSSIWDPNGVAEGNWDVSGNRLYQNDGVGRFTDVSLPAGVRQGYWGWASCFADFDNDGNLDLFHVNGMRMGDVSLHREFWADPSRLFMSNGDGTFTERSMEFGLNDRGQGRGVVCFDADRDGDIDVFVANNGTSPAFYVNEVTNGNNYLGVVLRGASRNTQGIGARVTVATAAGETQVREIRAGGNYVSQDPAEAHFGLGQDESVTVTVKWPDGNLTILQDVTVNQVLVVPHPSL